MEIVVMVSKLKHGVKTGVFIALSIMGPGMPVAFRQLHHVNLSKSNNPHQICF